MKFLNKIDGAKDLVQDSNNRLVTDAEKTAWNAKGTSNLALGTTSLTAFRGDYGNTAYTHSQSAHAPSGAQVNQTLTSGNGMAAWTATNGNLTIPLGTPSTLTTATTNAVTTTSHTHSVTFPVTSVAGKTGAVTLGPTDVGAAATSHGNHVPTTGTANNAIFLRNDNSWQTVTPANIGAATSGHNHDVSTTTGNLPASRISEPPYVTGSITRTARPLFDILRADRTSFLPETQIIIEKSTDAGVTWTDANVSDSIKRKLFTGQRPAISIPLKNGVKSTDCMIRITITGMRYNVPPETIETERYNYWNSTYVQSVERYFSAQEGWSWVSSNSDRIYLKVEKATGSNSNSWSLDREAYLSGWSGGNYFSLSGGVFGGGTDQTSNTWNWRFTFRTCSVKDTFNNADLSESYTTSSQTIHHIKISGQSVWSYSNNYMYHDHLYNWDEYKNAIFPAEIKGSTFRKSDGTEVAYKTEIPSALSELNKNINFDERYYTETEVDTKLNDKADKSQVLTNVPANAKFTDTNTITSINGKTGAIAKADIVALGIPAQDTVVDISGKADKAYVDNKALPIGGATGQVLAKTTEADNDANWVDPVYLTRDHSILETFDLPEKVLPWESDLFEIVPGLGRDGSACFSNKLDTGEDYPYASIPFEADRAGTVSLWYKLNLESGGEALAYISVTNYTTDEHEGLEYGPGVGVSEWTKLEFNVSPGSSELYFGTATNEGGVCTLLIDDIYMDVFTGYSHSIDDHAGIPDLSANPDRLLATNVDGSSLEFLDKSVFLAKGSIVPIVETFDDPYSMITWRSDDSDWAIDPGIGIDGSAALRLKNPGKEEAWVEFEFTTERTTQMLVYGKEDKRGFPNGAVVKLLLDGVNRRTTRYYEEWDGAGWFTVSPGDHVLRVVVTRDFTDESELLNDYEFCIDNITYSSTGDYSHGFAEHMGMPPTELGKNKLLALSSSGSSIEYVNKSDFMSKTEADALLEEKASKSDFVSKIEADALLEEKASKSAVPAETGLQTVEGKNQYYPIAQDHTGRIIGIQQETVWDGSVWKTTGGVGLGHYALQNNTGKDSNGVGAYCLQNNTGANSNGFGHFAMRNNTGSDSNGFGYFALQSNIGVSSNGFGHNALQGNTGSYSNGFGAYSLVGNTGEYSNGFGTSALESNTGSYSNGVGSDVMQYNKGEYSNGFGYQALQHNTGEASNGFGAQALQRNTGTRSNGFGALALQHNTGSDNSAFGYQANNTTNATIKALSNTTCLGAGTLPNKSNQVVLGNGSVDTVKMGGTARTPASSTSTGVKGETCWDTNYFYVCVATNIWKRIKMEVW